MGKYLRILIFVCLLLVMLTLLNYYLYDDNSYSRVMMHELFLEDDVNVLFAGSSAAYRHFNPEIWDKVLDCSTFNSGTSAQRPEHTYYLLQEIFKHFKPEYVIYAQSAIMYTKYSNWDIPTNDYIVYDYLPNSINKLKFGYHLYYPDRVLDGMLQFTRNRNKNIMKTLNDISKVKRTSEYLTFDHNVYKDLDNEQLNPKGYVSRLTSFKEKEIGLLKILDIHDYSVNDDAIEYINKIAQLCQDNNCKLIFVVPPMHYGSMANYYDYQEVVDFNRNIADSIGAPIFDFSLAKHDFLSMKDSYYYDWAHMSGNGADYFSSVCSEFIRRYISGEEINNDDYFYKSYQDLLEDTPWIYNAWIVKDEKGFQAFCNHGNGVTPLYSFFGSEDNGDTWEIIKEYSSSDTVSFEDVDENYNMLMVKVKDVNSKSEYDQLYRMTLE